MGRVDHACQMMVLRSDISPNHIHLVKEDRRIHYEFYYNFTRLLISLYDYLLMSSSDPGIESLKVKV